VNIVYELLYLIESAWLLLWNSSIFEKIFLLSVSIANIIVKKTNPRSTWISNLAFWVVLAIISALLSDQNIGLVQVLKIQFFNIGFFAVMVYFNIFYLFPLYLKQKKISMHLIYLLVTAAVLTPIKTLILFLISPSYGLKVSFIESQYASFLVTFLVGAASSIYYILSDWINSQTEKKELANQTLQSELKFLKSQINPHFLFNTLNSLYALTLKKSDLAPEIVLKLSEMMRYMLYECNEKIVPLEKEVNYLINYLDLEKLRHGKKIDINFTQVGEIRNQKIAPLLFIPFIENCFKHGVSNQIAAAFVNIDIVIADENVFISIENSKHAVMPGVHMKKSGGIGLVNVKRRLDLLYPDHYVLDVSDTPSTYKVELNLSLDSNIL
jgi:two-component system, LytTR family, sensor kinase